MNETPPAPSTAAPPSSWRWGICGILMMASTLNYMDRLTLNQTSVRIMASFEISALEYSLLESVFVFAFGIGTLTMGIIVDRVGVRVVYPLAVLGWSLFGFLTGFAPSFWMLLVCRFGLGLFESGNWPCGIRTTRQVMQPQERSLGNSLFQSGTAIGAIVTPFIVFWSIRAVDPDEPQRSATAAVTGAGAVADGYFLGSESWRVPFIIIGVIGLAWVLLWVCAVPRRLLNDPADSPTGSGPKAPPTPFRAVFRDRRFWVLIAVIIGVNTSWHTFRTWLPPYLQKQEGFSFSEMTHFTTWYYIIAELGAWTVGLGTLVLVWLGVNLHRSRVLTFALCTLIVLSAGVLPFLEAGDAKYALLLVFGFGAFGLFPTYFTLSQELSGEHQGKVTGTLGLINALYMTILYPIEGLIADTFGRYDPCLALCGLPALAALFAIVIFWREPTPDRGD